MKQHELFDEPQEPPPLAPIPLERAGSHVEPRDTTESSIPTQDRTAPPVASSERGVYLDLERFVSGR